MAANPSGAGYCTPRSVAARTIPRAIGCSERLSSAAARRSTSCSVRPARGTTSVTPKRPSVRVPVLSTGLSAPRGKPGGHRDDERHREAEGVGAGDHHDRHHTLEREAELAACAKPGDEGERPSPDRNEREPEGGAVREILGAGPCLLGFAHQLDHLREVGVGTGPPDFDGDRALAIHGAPDDFVALALLYQLGLAGEHRLVDARTTCDDQPVGRDLLSWLYEP